MAHPRAGVDYPRSVGELQAWFSTDASCLDYLEWLRWPGGFICSCLRTRGGLETWRWSLHVCRVRLPDIGDGGHDL